MSSWNGVGISLPAGWKRKSVVPHRLDLKGPPRALDICWSFGLGRGGDGRAGTQLHCGMAA